MFKGNNTDRAIINGKPNGAWLAFYMQGDIMKARELGQRGQRNSERKWESVTSRCQMWRKR